jgi:hypothetical protein
LPVQLLRAVYFARHAVAFAWGDTVTSGEVVVALNSAGGVVAGETRHNCSVPSGKATAEKLALLTNMG